jgi:zinc protease
MNRQHAPEFQAIRSIQLPEAEKSAGSAPQIYYINAGTQDVLRIECLFFAGSRFEKIPLSSTATNQCIKEGTSKYSSAEIAERLDFFGAFLENETNKDTGSLVLYTLSKHLQSCLPIFQEILNSPVFPEKEVDLFLQNNKQRYLVNKEKVDYLARVKFSEMIFGGGSQYGHVPTDEDYDRLSRNHIVDFYRSYYDLSNAVVLVSGKITERERTLIEQFLKPTGQRSAQRTEQNTILEPASLKRQFVEKAGAVQSAIRIGRPMFNRRHPDYFRMLVLNTILGGYFGSRLMANIREDKGYTYGIGSSIGSLHKTGMFFITTEVGADVTGDAINEIYKEIARLREQAIPDDELELVRNYMLGTFLRSMDGPFAISDKHKTLIEYGLGSDYYQNYIHTVNSVTSKELQALANEYFRQEDLYQLVVGSVNPG